MHASKQANRHVSVILSGLIVGAYGLKYFNKNTHASQRSS